MHNKNIFFSIFFLCISCRENVSHVISGETMGTSYSIKIISNEKTLLDVTNLQNAIDSLLNEINASLSTYIEDSEINRFNSHIDGKGFMASDVLLELVRNSLFYHKISHGDFDVTVGPIVREWGFSTSNNLKMIPDSSRIMDLLSHAGSDKILIKDNYLYKADPLLELDLGAIAKGWAVDQIAKYLDSFNFNNYLVEIGGEIYVSGTNLHGFSWEIGIRSPERFDGDINIDGDIFDIIKLSNMAIATSGTYHNYFEMDGNSYSHIIDPSSGYPIKQDIISATVISKKCIDVDAIATAVMVKGSLLGMEWVNSMDSTEALFIIKNDHGDYTSITSTGFSDY